MSMVDKDPRKEAIKRTKDMMKLLETEFRDFEIEGFEAELEIGFPHIGKGSLRVKMKKKRNRD